MEFKVSLTVRTREHTSSFSSLGPFHDDPWSERKFSIVPYRTLHDPSTARHANPPHCQVTVFRGLSCSLIFHVTMYRSLRQRGWGPVAQAGQGDQHRRFVPRLLPHGQSRHGQLGLGWDRSARELLHQSLRELPLLLLFSFSRALLLSDPLCESMCFAAYLTNFDIFGSYLRSVAPTAHAGVCQVQELPVLAGESSTPLLGPCCQSSILWRPHHVRAWCEPSLFLSR